MPQDSELRPGFGALLVAEPGETLDSLKTAPLRQRLEQQGALLLRGFLGDVDAFNRFTASFGHRFVAHGAPHRKPVSEDTFVHDADPGMHEIHLHTELGYFPIFPDTLWFRCVTPPREDGETTVCDGVALWNALSPECRATLREKRLRYSAFWAPDVWRRYFQVADAAELERKLAGLADVEYSISKSQRLSFEYWVSAVKKTVYGGHEAFANSLLHYALDGMADYVHFESGEPIPPGLVQHVSEVARPLTVAVRWQAGDVLMIDNSRVLHGRNAHADPARKLQAKLGRLAPAGA